MFCHGLSKKQSAWLITQIHLRDSNAIRVAIHANASQELLQKSQWKTKII